MKYPYFTSSYYIRGFFGEHRWLSNFHLAPFSGLMIRDGVTEQLTFPSVENFYQYRKLLFADADKTLLEACLACSPIESKRLGKNVDLGPKQIHWDTVKRLTVMEEGINSKFRQNPDLMEKLLATDGKHLEESNSWGGKFWGVSYIQKFINGEMSALGDKWDKIGGKNMLGHLLMKTRAQLFLENFNKG